MPFPVQVGELEIPHAAGLGYVVAADLAADGGTVIPGESAFDWLPRVAADLDAEEQRSLIRALLQRRDADAVSLACAVGRAVQTEGIGPYYLSALLHHDVGTLMSPDPWGRSVEELLATTGAELCPLDDVRWRSLVLASLRTTGAFVYEARVLAAYGTEAEIREWGPPLLATGDDAVRSAFEGARTREAVAWVVEELLGG